MKNILVSGRPGVGKTTLAKKVAERLGVDRCGGFTTGEIREAGVRKGFRIDGLSGASGVLAHAGFKSGYRVGRYGVNVADLERVGVSSIREALEGKEYVIIDEIGEMELYLPAFREAVLEALDSGKPVLATVHKHRHPFTDEVKSRGDVELLEVTGENRDRLADELVEKLTAGWSP